MQHKGRHATPAFWLTLCDESNLQVLIVVQFGALLLLILVNQPSDLYPEDGCTFCGLFYDAISC